MNTKTTTETFKTSDYYRLSPDKQKAIDELLTIAGDGTKIQDCLDNNRLDEELMIWKDGEGCVPYEYMSFWAVLEPPFCLYHDGRKMWSWYFSDLEELASEIIDIKGSIIKAYHRTDELRKSLRR